AARSPLGEADLELLAKQKRDNPRRKEQAILHHVFHAVKVLSRGGVGRLAGYSAGRGRSAPRHNNGHYCEPARRRAIVLSSYSAAQARSVGCSSDSARSSQRARSWSRNAAAAA